MHSEESMRSRYARRPTLGAAICIAALLGSACFGGGQQAAQPTAGPAPQTTPAAAPPSPPRPSPSPSPSPSPAAISPGTGQTHTIEPGDTLASIAEKVYGDPTLWRRIYEANRETIGDNPDNITVGTQLRIPPKE